MGIRKKHSACLTGGERAEWEARFAWPLTLRQRNRAQVLLRADAGETDADIADELAITTQTSANVRKRFAAAGLETAPAEKPRSGSLLAGAGRPDGRTLATKLVELHVFASVLKDTILRVLERATSSLGRRRVGAR